MLSNKILLMLSALLLVPLQLMSQTITLRDTTNQFDYIIITVPEFVSACEPFKTHKETVRDFRTLIVDTTQIFAEFDSSATPQDNIREFISYAGTFWREPKPKFFLLVGTVNMIPNFFIYSPPAQAYYPSDYYYCNSIYETDSTKINFYVGRLPAKNTAEIDNYFAKIIEYENNNIPQSWMNNALFICEEEQVPFFEFLNATFEVSEHLPSYVRSYFISEADTSIYYGNMDSIYKAIEDRGCTSVWFEGHVTDSGFAYPNWFDLDDLKGLANQSKYFLSIFASSQFSIIDSNNNFTNELMFLSNAGSIGGVAFVSYAFWGSGKTFQNHWAERLFNTSVPSLGQAVLDSLPLAGGSNWYMKQITNLWADPSLVLKYDPTVDVEEIENEIATDYALYQNYPNPFNPSTNIGFRITDRGFVSIKVYDVLGNEVATLFNEEKPAGTYKVEFNANNLTSGIYFYQLKAGNLIETKKMLLLK